MSNRQTGPNKKTGKKGGARRKCADAKPVPYLPSEESRNLLDLINDGIVVFDAEMNYVYVNKTGGNILGCKPADLVGKNYWVVYPEAKGTVFANACARAMETQETIVFENYYTLWERRFENRVYPSNGGLAIFFTEITDRKQIENSMREHEERYRLFHGILRSTSDGILAINRENEVVFANERFVELWMIPQEIMASKDDTLLLQHVLDQLSNPQEFLQKVQELYDSTEKSFDTLFFKDGRVFERLSRPLLRGSEMYGRVWSFRDVTARKRTEETLAASEAELRALFASMHDVVLVIDREGVYRKIGQTDPGSLVKPSAELLGKNLSDVFPVEQAEDFRRVVQRVLETNQSAHIEYELNIGGQTVWFQTAITSLDSDNTLWVAHDITGRKKMEEALRTAEASYRSIFENAPVGIYQSTSDGRFLSVNPVLAGIFGYESPEEILANIVSIENQFYVDPANRVEFRRLMMEHGGVQEFISLYKRKDGSHIWVQENTRAVKDADGNILYYEGFIINITQRKQAVEELRRAKEFLETANIELELSLEREKLLACTDGLTGLYNHRHFLELAAREFSAALRHGHPLTILMFDMDDFKLVNDTLGHVAGDQLLAQAGRTAVAQLRLSDVVARYGGDEFIVLLPQASAADALPVAERIRAGVAALRVEGGQNSIAITLSMGIAELQREPLDDDVERVIQRADEALYAAKEQGRNRTIIYGLQG